MAQRAAKTAVTGKKPGSRPPALPVEGPRPTDQVNLTGEQSRIMPVAGGGFEQCYNAQAVVAAGSLPVIAADVTQGLDEKQQLEPMLDQIAALPNALGRVGALLGNNECYSKANVESCAAAGIDPLIAMGREAHHPLLEMRFAEPPPQGATPPAAMSHGAPGSKNVRSCPMSNTRRADV